METAVMVSLHYSEKKDFGPGLVVLSAFGRLRQNRLADHEFMANLVSVEETVAKKMSIKFC